MTYSDKNRAWDRWMQGRARAAAELEIAVCSTCGAQVRRSAGGDWRHVGPCKKPLEHMKHAAINDADAYFEFFPEDEAPKLPSGTRLVDLRNQEFVVINPSAALHLDPGHVLRLADGVVLHPSWMEFPIVVKDSGEN